MAPRAWATVTRRKVATRPSPRLRAVSSWPGSALRRLAATGRYTSGYAARVMTTTAPRNPWAQVVSDAHPKLTTKSGMANGTTTRTAQTRRPGRLVRSTNQAASVPITAQSPVTTTISRTVFHSRAAVSGRQISLASVASPAPRASISRKTSGASMTAATAMLAPSRTHGTGARRALTVSPAAGRRCRAPGRAWVAVTAGRPA